MALTDSGMLTDLKEVHPEKAEVPMDVTEPGIATDASDEHP